MTSEFHYSHQQVMLLLQNYVTLNTDLKLISKPLGTQLKDILPDLISFNQSTYVQNRYICESGKLIYDVLQRASILKRKWFLVTVNIEKLLIQLTILFH